jgi:predicted DNA-binding protein
MSRADTFSFRLNAEDRRRLERIARRLERSQSDAIRWLIRHAVQEMEAGIELASVEAKKQ